MYKWAILFFAISILDSFVTLAVIKMGIAKEASPLAIFLLGISDSYFLSTRTGLIALAVIPLEVGCAKQWISETKRIAYYKLAIISYVVVYIVGILKANT